MRFLVDECLPRRLTALITNAGHDAVHVIDGGRRGLRDAGIWSWAASENRVLVTADKGFPRDERPAPPGVVLLRLPNSFSGMEIAAVFSAFITQRGLDGAHGQITVIQPDRVRLRAFDPR